MPTLEIFDHWYLEAADYLGAFFKGERRPALPVYGNQE